MNNTPQPPIEYFHNQLPVNFDNWSDFCAVYRKYRKEHPTGPAIYSIDFSTGARHRYTFDESFINPKK